MFILPFIKSLLIYLIVFSLVLVIYTAIYYVIAINVCFDKGIDIQSLKENTFVKQIKFWALIFTIFISILFFVWILILLILKLYYGIIRVGCAAGGTIVDILQLKKVYNLNKYERKVRIIRNWRIQTICLLSCISIIPFSITMIILGLQPFIQSLYDIQDINNHIESDTYRSIQIITQLQTTYEQLSQLLVVQQQEQTSLNFYNDLCPNPTDAIVSLIQNTTSSNSTGNTSISTTTTNITSMIQSILGGYDPNQIQRTIISHIEQIQYDILQQQYDMDVLIYQNDHQHIINQYIHIIYVRMMCI